MSEDMTLLVTLRLTVWNMAPEGKPTQFDKKIRYRAKDLRDALLELTPAANAIADALADRAKEAEPQP